MSTIVAVDDLKKTFRQGFLMRRVEAVQGISFSVHANEIFGFLGPNGAGKTTTIKMLTGLIAPTSGHATVFGHQVPSPAAMKRVGFLPENPYVYPYLTPREFVELCGRLSGLSGAATRSRTQACLERVGVAYAGDRQVRRLSKGMLQRTGLAAALVADPELLMLDEPMSGLDPVGRKEVRDLILDERKGGRTIFFSTHILTDVETLCDRVVILRKGKVVVSGLMKELLRGDVRRTEITLAEASEELEGQLKADGVEIKRVGDHLVAEIEGESKVSSVLRGALAANARVLEVHARRETLEDLFVRRAIQAGD